MTDKIKNLQESGLSIRAVAEIVGLDKDTVNKYFKMSDEEIGLYQVKPRRVSQFHIALDDIIDILRDPERHKMSTVKMHREIKTKYPFITSGVRALHDFIKPLIEIYRSTDTRIYEPVKHLASRCQIQVDGGECYFLISEGKKRKCYFIAFTLCFSGSIFVAFQFHPFNTQDLIRAHIESFQYFGGVGREYLYDQTTLVIISENYRELSLNSVFQQFKNKYCFRVLSCGKGDPESKGKVENTIGYIKRDFLYGSYFPDLQSMRVEALKWLDTVANVRIHGTTKRLVKEAFLEVKPYLNTEFYNIINKENRKVDKTGLISYKGNYFSVPYAYQRKEVSINPMGDILHAFDILSGHPIAEHIIPEGKGNTITAPSHYPCKIETEKRLTHQVLESLKDIGYVEELICRLKEDQEDIIRAQLRGLISLSKKYNVIYWHDIKDELLSLPKIGCKLVEKLLQASLLNQATEVVGGTLDGCSPRPPSRYAPVCAMAATIKCSNIDTTDEISIVSSCLDRDIKIYNRSIKNDEPN
jgi:hypothetical protein